MGKITRKLRLIQKEPRNTELILEEVDGFFEIYKSDHDLYELLDYADQKITPGKERDSAWLLSEASAYKNLEGKELPRKKVDEIINLFNLGEVRPVNKKIRKLYPRSPINRDGTYFKLHTAMSDLPIYQAFLDISNNLVDDSIHEISIARAIEYTKITDNFTVGKLNVYRLLLKPLLYVLNQDGGLDPELYHAIHLAREFETQDSLESYNVAKCFYGRTLELLKERLHLVQDDLEENCGEKLDSLSNLIRSARVDLQA